MCERERMRHTQPSRERERDLHATSTQIVKTNDGVSRKREGLHTHKKGERGWRHRERVERDTHTKKGEMGGGRSTVYPVQYLFEEIGILTH